MGNDSLWIVVGLPIASLVIGLVSGYIGQLYFAPRVARRERARQRWDAHAEEIGNLITSDYPQRITDFDLAGEAVIDEWARRPGIESADVRAARRHFLTVYKDVLHMFTRMWWLSERLSKGYAGPPGSARIAAAAKKASSALEAAYAAFERTEGDKGPILVGTPSLDEWAVLTDALDDAVGDLLDLVVAVADGRA